MPTTYTSLIGLALPTTGELSGTWGDTVNNYISTYIDAAVAGTQTITTDTTLTKTTGAALDSTSSQYMVLRCSPSSANLTVTVPAASKAYVVINTSGTYTVTIRGAGPTTGVTLAVNEKAIVAWNGSDFVKISSTSATALNVGTLAVANGGTGLSSIAATSIPVANTANTYTTIAPGAGQSVRVNSTGTAWEAFTPSGGGGSGTVTKVSVVSANGLAGTVANDSTTPAITISTTITGLLKGNGTAISAASSGTDYAPATSGTSILYGNGSGGFSNVTVGSGLDFSTGILSATGGGGGGVAQPFITMSTGGNQPPSSFNPSDSFALI
jgi:hypothetical protein